MCSVADGRTFYSLKAQYHMPVHNHQPIERLSAWLQMIGITPYGHWTIAREAVCSMGIKSEMRTGAVRNSFCPQSQRHLTSEVCNLFRSHWGTPQIIGHGEDYIGERLGERGF